MAKDITETQLRRLLEKGIAEHGSQKDYADGLGISRSLLSNVIQNRCDPPPKLLTALGYQRVITYRPIVKD